MPLADDIERLLSASMVAHTQALAARRQPGQQQAARDFLHTAYDRRMEAQRLDPDHTVPAWTDTRTKGRERHDQLCAFYEQQLLTLVTE